MFNIFPQITYMLTKFNAFFFSKLQEKVFWESYRGGRSEPAGLSRLRRQVTEAEGPLELRREKGKGYTPRGGEGEEKAVGVLLRGSVHLHVML